MSADIDLNDGGLTREDQVVARVVIDLGLMAPADVESAVKKVKDGGGATLAQLLQESGRISPRFLSTVEKVVKSRLATSKALGAKRPPARAPVRSAEKADLRAPARSAEKADLRAPVRSAEKDDTRAPAERPRASRRLARHPRDAERKQILPSLAPPPGRAQPEPGGAPGATEPKATPSPSDRGDPKGRDSGPAPQEKDPAIIALIERVVPSRLHERCLETVLKRGLGTVSAVGLKLECGCSELEAERVLNTWRSAGVVSRGKGDYEIGEYGFAPSEADLDVMRRFMEMWGSPETHDRLLGWILERE